MKCIRPTIGAVIVSIGICPILFITGFVMWWHQWRKKGGNRTHETTLIQAR